MNEKILKYLYDIKRAIDKIDSFFIDFEKEYEVYRNNTLLRRATERNLEINGEAVNRILNIEPDFPINNAKKIIGLRNQIIHAYEMFLTKMFGE